MLEKSIQTVIHEVQLDARENLQRIANLSSSMESLRQTIVSEGMSRDVAQLIEQTVPGSITNHSRINGFTRYPSPVNVNVGLEAIDTIKSMGIKALIIGLISAAVAIIAGLVSYLMKKFKGKQADQRNKRANNRKWDSEKAVNVGLTRMDWHKDALYRGGVELFTDRITKLLVNIGSGEYNTFIDECITRRSVSLFYALADHIETNVKTMETALSEIKNLALRTSDINARTRVHQSIIKIRDEFQLQFDIIDRVPAKGLPGKGTISDRLVMFRSILEEDSGISAISQHPTDQEIYGFHSVIIEGLEFLQHIDTDAMMAKLNVGGARLQQVLNTSDTGFYNVDGETSELLMTCTVPIQSFLDMQADLIAIVTMFMEEVTRADDAYCAMLREQIAAMKRAGVNFTGSEPEFAADRIFYHEAKKYLGD